MVEIQVREHGPHGGDIGREHGPHGGEQVEKMVLMVEIQEPIFFLKSLNLVPDCEAYNDAFLQENILICLIFKILSEM
jgi:hypothetical protein